MSGRLERISSDCKHTGRRRELVVSSSERITLEGDGRPLKGRKEEVSFVEKSMERCWSSSRMMRGKSSGIFLAQNSESVITSM